MSPAVFWDSVQRVLAVSYRYIEGNNRYSLKGSAFQQELSPCFQKEANYHFEVN